MTRYTDSPPDDIGALVTTLGIAIVETGGIVMTEGVEREEGERRECPDDALTGVSALPVALLT